MIMSKKQKPIYSVRAEKVWKIFGERWREAFDDIQKNKIQKKKVLEKYNCVVGVEDVSFKVEKGEIFCIMGLSGSGKSTLVRHINRLLEPTFGKIYVNDEDILSISDKKIQHFRNQTISMVFQNFALMPHRSIYDNVALPLEIRGVNKSKRIEIAEKTLEMVNLNGWGNKFIQELSGGMQQRVGLARALVSDTDILLMDEPFSALDPLIRRQLQDQFMEISAKMKKTTLFITHDLDEAIKIGDRIAIMRDGKIIQIGKPRDIILKPADKYVADFVSNIPKEQFK